MKTGPIPGAPHFTWQEMFASETAKAQGIDNTPDTDEVYDRLQFLAQTVLEPVRLHFDRPIVVTSGYRCPALNRAVKGSPTSWHAQGCAADIRFERGTTEVKDRDIFEYIARNLPFTELIAEGVPIGWVHIAISRGREQEKAIKYMLDSEGLVKRSDLKTVLSLYDRYGV